MSNRDGHRAIYARDYQDKFHLRVIFMVNQVCSQDAKVSAVPRLGGRLSPTHVPKIKSDPQLGTPVSQKKTTHFSILFIPKLTSDLKISSNFALSDMVLISASTTSCSARCRLPGAPACANHSRQCLRQSFLSSNVSALQGQRRVCRSARLSLSLVKVRSLTKKDTHIHPCYNTVSNSLHRDLGHTRVSTAVRVLTLENICFPK